MSAPPAQGPSARQPAYKTYRDAVTILMHADEPFDEVVEAIDGTALEEDARAALWLLAFSMREPRERLRVARSGGGVVD